MKRVKFYKKIFVYFFIFCIFGSCDPYRNESMQKRIIAHAGGSIEEATYTNCLEVLDLSYKKGFRLFELDIIKTKDGHFVAAHDWGTWKSQTGYNGSSDVPTLEEFKEWKILGTYTPLDVDRINDWFVTHEDAILITDKVNEPVEFINNFSFKERIKMELFTWEAVDKCKKLGVVAMPTGLLVDGIEGSNKNKIDYLKKLDIEFVCYEYKIHDNIDLLKMFKKNNIKVFVFDYKKFNKTAEDVIEENLFYGLYADDWIFNVSF